jgi:hypothetical protein
MNRILVFSLLLVLPLSAQEAAKPSALDAAGARITGESLKAHLSVIASDEYAGRNSGFPGNDKAAEYIAAHFKKIGLRPAGEKDAAGETTWFQGFTLGKPPRATRNVLGIVEGSDPELKKEIVVVGAHHDHAGQDGEPSPGRMVNKKADKDDKIWNGADDNGSGTVTVLEIARAFMEGKIRTKRSVLFMTFSGEEYGLLGSRHYVDHPLHPLENTVAMINLDMVGRNGNKPMEVGAVSTSAAWTDLCKEAEKGVDLEYATSPSVIPGSDHFSFFRKKIPVVHFFTGFHADYHCQSDHVEKIDFDRMAKIGRFGLRLLALTADRPSRIEFSEPRKLGIDAEELDDEAAAELSLPKGSGGVKVLKVNENSAAARAGVKEDDVIVEFNGKAMPLEEPLAQMRTALKGVKDGDEVPFVVLRAGKRVELKAVWGKKVY